MSGLFDSLNNYYDKILVLTLPRLTDRMAYFKKTFVGLNYEFFYGIDKEHTSMEILKNEGLYSTEAYRKYYKKPQEISLGMLCCSLGHFKIYDYIIKNNFAKTLIFEDDAIPVVEELKKFSAIVRELPADWEMLYLGYEKHDQFGWKEKLNRLILTLIPHHTQLKLNRDIFKNYYASPVSAQIAKAGFHDCTHAYSVTLEGAKKLMAMQNPVTFHPDNLISFLVCSGKLNGYISNPKLFNQLTAFNNQQSSLTSPDSISTVIFD